MLNIIPKQKENDRAYYSLKGVHNIYKQAGILQNEIKRVGAKGFMTHLSKLKEICKNTSEICIKNLYVTQTQNKLLSYALTLALISTKFSMYLLSLHINGKGHFDLDNTMKEFIDSITKYDTLMNFQESVKGESNGQ